jgi:hypothetical protein
VQSQLSYRERAEECLALAEMMGNGDARVAMRQIAAQWTALADLVERHANSTPSDQTGKLSR